MENKLREEIKKIQIGQTIFSLGGESVEVVTLKLQELEALFNFYAESRAQEVAEKLITAFRNALGDEWDVYVSKFQDEIDLQVKTNTDKEGE